VTTRIQKWGNSQGVRISKALMADAHLSVGDEVDISVQDGALIITSASRVRGSRDLVKLVREIPPGYRPGEFDWADPVGREVG
jgi:antitoxin MazE